MKILITGATGFLGRHLWQKLSENGHQVTGTGRNLELGEKLIHQGGQFFPADLNNQQNIIDLCQNQDFVIHCAAKSSLWGRYSDFYQSNVLGTRNIIEGCLKADVKKLIYISSPSIYFNFQSKLNIKETQKIPDNKVNHYITTKRLAELEIDAAIRQGLNCITLRPRGIFGPHDKTILPKALKAIEQNRFPLINHGQALIDLTYVENVVQAIILCLTADPKYNGQKYNVTNNQPIPLIEFIQKTLNELSLSKSLPNLSYKLAHALASLLELKSKFNFIKPTEPLLTRYAVGLLYFDQTLNIQAIQNDLGYKPSICLDEGIKRFANWWKNEKL